MSKDHETEGWPNHATCGFAIGTLDITRHLGFREGAAIESILLAGDAPVPVEKIPGEGRKARHRRARKLAKLEGINEAIDLLTDLADELEAELKLGDPSRVAAILEGMEMHDMVTLDPTALRQQAVSKILAAKAEFQRELSGDAFWNANDDKLHGRETAEHSAQLDLEQDEELDSPVPVSWDDTSASSLTVRYAPTEANDPWGHRNWTENFKGIETVGDLKNRAVSQMHFGHPEGFRLAVRDGEFTCTLLTEFDVISDVLKPGQTVHLVRALWALTTSARS